MPFTSSQDALVLMYSKGFLAVSLGVGNFLLRMVEKFDWEHFALEKLRPIGK